MGNDKGDSQRFLTKDTERLNKQLWMFATASRLSLQFATDIADPIQYSLYKKARNIAGSFRYAQITKEPKSKVIGVWGMVQLPF